jgi:hypothetical protein
MWSGFMSGAEEIVSSGGGGGEGGGGFVSTGVRRRKHKLGSTKQGRNLWYHQEKICEKFIPYGMSSYPVQKWYNFIPKN